MILPSFLSFDRTTASVKEMVLETSREEQYLFVLTTQNRIQAWSLGPTGEGMTHLFTSPNLINEYADALGLQSRDARPSIVSIFPVSKMERPEAYVMALTTRGDRMYFTIQTSALGSSLCIHELKRAASALTTHLTPSPAALPDTISAGESAISAVSSIAGSVPTPTTDAEIRKALVSNGQILLAPASATGRAGTGMVLSISKDPRRRDPSGSAATDFTSSTQTSTTEESETLEIVSMPGVVLDMTESTLHSGGAGLARFLYAGQHSRPLSGLRELGVQHLLHSREFLFLTTTGLVKVVKKWPIDDLVQVLKGNSAQHGLTPSAALTAMNDRHSALQAFIEAYGPLETSVMCLMIIAQPRKSAQIAARAAGQGPRPGHESDEIDESLTASAAQAFLISSSSCFSEPQKLSKTLDLRRKALSLALARLLRPVWDWTLGYQLQDNQKRGNAVRLRYRQRELEGLKAPLVRLNAFLRKDWDLVTLQSASTRTPTSTGIGSQVGGNAARRAGNLLSPSARLQHAAADMSAAALGYDDSMNLEGASGLTSADDVRRARLQATLELLQVSIDAFNLLIEIGRNMRIEELIAWHLTASATATEGAPRLQQGRGGEGAMIEASAAPAGYPPVGPILAGSRNSTIITATWNLLAPSLNALSQDLPAITFKQLVTLPQGMMLARHMINVLLLTQGSTQAQTLAALPTIPADREASTSVVGSAVQLGALEDRLARSCPFFVPHSLYVAAKAQRLAMAAACATSVAESERLLNQAQVLYRQYARTSSFNAQSVLALLHKLGHDPLAIAVAIHRLDLIQNHPLAIIRGTPIDTPSTNTTTSASATVVVPTATGAKAQQVSPLSSDDEAWLEGQVQVVLQAVTNLVADLIELGDEESRIQQQQGQQRGILYDAAPLAITSEERKQHYDRVVELILGSRHLRLHRALYTLLLSKGLVSEVASIKHPLLEHFLIQTQRMDVLQMYYMNHGMPLKAAVLLRELALTPRTAAPGATVPAGVPNTLADRQQYMIMCLACIQQCADAGGRGGDRVVLDSGIGVAAGGISVTLQDLAADARDLIATLKFQMQVYTHAKKRLEQLKALHARLTQFATDVASSPNSPAALAAARSAPPNVQADPNAAAAHKSQVLERVSSQLKNLQDQTRKIQAIVDELDSAVLPLHPDLYQVATAVRAWDTCLGMLVFLRSNGAAVGLSSAALADLTENVWLNMFKSEIAQHQWLETLECVGFDTSSEECSTARGGWEASLTSLVSRLMERLADDAATVCPLGLITAHLERLRYEYGRPDPKLFGFVVDVLVSCRLPLLNLVEAYSGLLEAAEGAPPRLQLLWLNSIAYLLEKVVAAAEREIFATSSTERARALRAASLSLLKKCPRTQFLNSRSGLDISPKMAEEVANVLRRLRAIEARLA